MSKEKIVKFSTLGFILSSIGAAVGLGNLWRFPQVMVKNGGAAFILVYFIVLALIVLPIALIELNYGFFFRKGMIQCYSKTGGFLGRTLGWKQVIMVGFLSIYHLLLLSWVGVIFVLSIFPQFFSQFTWGNNYFNQKILNITSNDINSTDDFHFAPWVFLSAVVLIFIAFFIVKAGIEKGLQKANFILIPSLFVLLLAITLYVVFGLEDSYLGTKVLFNFDYQKMGDPFIWYDATKQAIWSTGIMFGVLIVFAKSANFKIDKGNEMIIVLLVDTLVGMVAGILIIGLITHETGQTAFFQNFNGSSIDRSNQLAQKVQEKLNANNEQLSGSGLLFSYLPVLFNKINGPNVTFGIGNVLMIAFTLSLIFAALSSLIGDLEIFTDAVINNLKMKRIKAIFLWIILAFSFIYFYTSSLGPKLLERQDNIIMLFVLFIGTFEVISYVKSKYYKDVIKNSDQYTYLKLKKFNWHRNLVYFFIAPILITLCIFGFMQTFGINYLLTQQKSFVDFFGSNNSQTWTSFKQKSEQFIFDLPQIISLLMFAFSIFITIIFSYISRQLERKELISNKNNLK